jgi:uncharacterized membrane protein
MNWAAFSSVFLVATFKFLFSPFAGIPLGLDFLTTYLAAVSGATISSLFFYFGAEIIMGIARKNKLNKEIEAEKKGILLKPKKKFTRGNKMTIKLKRTFGKIGLCFLAPTLLSIPFGTIIVAKFYGKEKDTFLWVFIGILLSGLVTTSLAYFVFSK